MLKSDKFAAELSEYLKEALTLEVKHETNRKIHTLCRKWQNVFLDKSHDTFERICRTIENDPKFKMPWTQNEVNTAIESVRTNFALKCL